MTPQMSYIDYKLTEYMPAFDIHHVIALPVIDFVRNTNGYLDFDIQHPLIAMNGLHETFIYTPGICRETHGYTICPPQNIELHTKPRYCSEALLQLSTENF